MSTEIIKLARPEIVSMQAYESARSTLKKGRIMLDANENPWNDGIYNRYPEPQPEKLLSLLSKQYKIPKNQLLLTRGSDEGIDLLLRLFCRAGVDSIMICPPTYGMYRVAGTIQNAEILEAPLKENSFDLDQDVIQRKWQSNAKILFLCSPNNPTGNLLKKDDILYLCKWLENKAIIVVDEAYIEFSDSMSLASLISSYPNLVVLRTLSKAYGLASIRCGVTLANPEMIALLRKIIAPYPIPGPITDIVYKKLQLNNALSQIQIIRSERLKLFNFLKQLPYVERVWESQGNYILFKADNAKNILEYCLKNGIILRDRSNDHKLSNCIRISVGTFNENEFLMKVLKNVK